MTKYSYKHTYEIMGKDGEQVQINYNSAREIGQIFVYNSYIDGMVEVNLDAFVDRHPSQFEAYQNKVNDLLSGTDNDHKEYNKYE